MEEEIWKFVKETNSRSFGKRIYEASNTGKVRCNGVILPLSNFRKTKYYADPTRTELLLHRLIAKLFIQNPENKPCVDHIDTNTYNNNVNNLRWTTHKENVNNELSLSKMSSAKIGKVYSDEYKQNMSKICKLISHTKEWNKHMAESKIGYIWINNGIINKQARDYNIDYYLNNGWNKGLLNKRWLNK